MSLMYNQNSVPADPLDSSYVAIVSEWLGSGLPSTDHCVTFDVWSREAEGSQKSSAFEEKSDAMWRTPTEMRLRRTYLLTQLEDLNDNNNNNKISLSLYEWTDGRGGMSQKAQKAKDEEITGVVVGKSADAGASDILIDDVTSDGGHDVIDDGFVLIDELSCPKEIAVSGKSLSSSEERASARREEGVLLNTLFVGRGAQNQSDNSNFESETELERSHSWKREAEVKKPSLKSESVSVSLSKEPHHKDIADHAFVASPCIKKYEDDMKLFFQTNDPSTDHFHLFTVAGRLENESGKSTDTKQVSSYRFHLKPNIQKRLLIQVNNPDWEFPELSMHGRDDSKYNSIFSTDNLPDEISTTGIYSANKTLDDSTTTTADASAFTSAHSIHIPGNIQFKTKPDPTAFESMITEELTNIIESGKKEVEKELGIPDFEFSEPINETKEMRGRTSEKESEASQMEKPQNVFLPDFDFDDAGDLGSKIKPYEKEHRTIPNKTKVKVETPTTPAKKITPTMKEQSKVGVGDQGNINLPSFGFMNLSQEVPAVSSNFSSTLTTTQKSETTAFENLVSQELTNIIAGKQDIEKQLQGQDYTSKVETSKVSEKVKGEIQGKKAGKESDTTQAEILRNIVLPDFDFDEETNLKTNKFEDRLQSKPVTSKLSGEVKTKVESAENASMTKTTTQITETKMEGREGLRKDTENVEKKVQEKDLPASSSSITAFEKMLTQELTSVIESGKKEAMKQMEFPDFTFDLQESNVNQKVTKDHESERGSEKSKIEKRGDISLPVFEFDETATTTTTTTTARIYKEKDGVHHVTSGEQTIKTTGMEKEKLTKEAKLENFGKATHGHVSIPSFDFENLSSREATSSVSSSMTFSTMKSKPQEGDDSVEFQKDENLGKHAELVGHESKSPLVTTQVSSKSVGDDVPKTSESPQIQTDGSEFSAASTQITTSTITFSKLPQSPERSNPKTSIKLISRAESHEKSKEVAEEKKQDLESFFFDLQDYQESPKHAEGVERSVDSNKVQLPTFGFDSHLPGQDKMYSIVADEEMVSKSDSKTSGKPTKASESTPETGNFTMIPFFKLKSNEGDYELETDITNTGKPSDFQRETAIENKNIKIEFPTFGSITTRADNIDGDARETKEEDVTKEIPNNDNNNETMLMQTGTETKFGSKAVPDESILNDGLIESYVKNIMDNAVNSIKDFGPLIEKSGDKSYDNDDEEEVDIVVPYRRLKDEDDEEEDKIKLFKKSVDTDGLGNIIVHKEGTKHDDDDDHDHDSQSGKVHLPGRDAGGQEFLGDFTHSSSERLRKLTSDLVVVRPPLTSNSSVEIVVTPATPVDRSVAIGDDWYGKLNETSLIEEEKMEEKRARQMTEETQNPSDNFRAVYEADDVDDEDDAEGHKNILTYDDDDMNIYDVGNDGDDDDDDDDGDDSNTDDDSSGPFSKYKREVIRISFDDDDDDGRKSSPSSSEDRINPGLYSPKKRFSLENIEPIKEENETAHMEDPFSPADHETETPGIFEVTRRKDVSDLVGVSSPRFQKDEEELGNVVSKTGSPSVTTSAAVAFTTPTSEATITTISNDGTAETSSPTYDMPPHSFDVTGQKPVTSVEQNVIIPATTTTAAVAATEVISTTTSRQQNDLDVLIPVAQNVRPSGQIHTFTDHSVVNINLPHVGLHSTSSMKTSQESSASVAAPTTSTSFATTDAREIGGRLLVGSLLSTVDVNVIPASPVPPSVMEDENWFGNTDVIEQEAVTFKDDEMLYDIGTDIEGGEGIKMGIPFFDIGQDLSSASSDLSISKGEGQGRDVTSFPLDVSPSSSSSSGGKALDISKQYFSVSTSNDSTTSSATSAAQPSHSKLSNEGISLPTMSTLISEGVSKSSFEDREPWDKTLSDREVNLPLITSSLLTTQSSTEATSTTPTTAAKAAPTEVQVSMTSYTSVSPSTTIVTSDVTTAPVSSDADAKEIGVRVLVGSLLSTTDVDVVPASPVQASVTEDANWSRNTERKVSYQEIYDNSLDDDEENEERTDSKEIENIFKMEIPFFDISHDLSSATSDPATSEIEGHEKYTTSFRVDKSSSSTKQFPVSGIASESIVSKADIPTTTTSLATVKREVDIPTLSSATNVDSTLTTTSASSAAEAIEIGERLLLGSLLSTVDVNVIPASPVPPSVMEDENWFGNTDMNEQESNLEQQDFGGLDDDIEIEDKIKIPFFDFESSNDVVEDKIGFEQIEIPFFDVMGDLPNDLSLSEVEVRDGVKRVTPSSVHTTSSSAKALDISTQFFDVSVATAPLQTATTTVAASTSAVQTSLTTSSNEGISLPAVSPLISEDQKTSRTTPEFDYQEYLDEALPDKGITDVGEKVGGRSITGQDDVHLGSGGVKRKRSKVKVEYADGEEDYDDEFMTKRPSSSIERSYHARIIDAPKEYNDSLVAERDDKENMKDFDIGKATIVHPVKAPDFSKEKRFESLDLTQEGEGKAKLQEFSTFGLDYQSKVIGGDFPKSQLIESESYDENIRRLDSLLERSRRELDVLRPGDKNETIDEDGKPHQESKEEENFLLDTTLDQSLAEFRDVSSVMSPGSDITEDSPTIGWRSTGKVRQLPLDNLLDSSALESPTGSGEVKVGRPTLDDNWLDTSTETRESLDKFELLPHEVPIKDEEKFTHLSGPIRKKDNVPVDSRMTDGSSMHKSISPPSSSSSSNVTFIKPSSRDDDDYDDLRHSSEIYWSIKGQQSNENKVEQYVTTNQASSPSSILAVTTTTRVMSDSLSSDLVSDSHDLTQKSVQQDSQKEITGTDISEVVNNNQEIEHTDFKALHEKSLKEIQSGVGINQPADQENEALDSKEISESSAKESISIATSLEPSTMKADDVGIKTDDSTLKSAVERAQVPDEISKEKSEPPLIIYSPGGDVGKVQDNMRGMDGAARNETLGIHIKQTLPDFVEVDKSPLSDVKIEVRDLDKTQEKDQELSTEGRIPSIASPTTATLHVAKDQSPTESTIAEGNVNVDTPKSETGQVVVDEGGIKTDDSTLKSAVERAQMPDEISKEKSEPPLIIYSPGGDVGKVQDNMRGMDGAARNETLGIHIKQTLPDFVEVDKSPLSDVKIEVRDLDKTQEKDQELSTEGRIPSIASPTTATLHVAKDQSPTESTIAEGNVNVDTPKSETGQVVVDEGGIKTDDSTLKSAVERAQMPDEISKEKSEPPLIIYSPGGDVGKVQDNMRGMAGAARNETLGIHIKQTLPDFVEVDKSPLSDVKIEVRDLDKTQEKDQELSTEGRIPSIASPTTATLYAAKYRSPTKSTIAEGNVNVDMPKSEPDIMEVDKSPLSDIKIEARDLDKTQEKDQELSTEGHISLVSPPATLTLQASKDHFPVEPIIAGGNLNMGRAKPRSGTGIKEIVIDDGGRNAESSGSIPIYSIREESEDASNWKEVVIADSKHLVDMKAIDPYKKCVTHGGYYGNGLNAIIVLSACYFPPRNIPNYTYVMDHLFFYIMNVLEVMAVDQYKLVYLHGTMTEAKLPPNKWMKKCYETIDRKLKKKMEQMLVVHPTFWLKTLIFLFASSKFSKKLVYVKSLADLNKVLSSQDLQIPEEVVEVDHKLNPPKKRSK